MELSSFDKSDYLHDNIECAADRSLDFYFDLEGGEKDDLFLHEFQSELVQVR